LVKVLQIIVESVFELESLTLLVEFLFGVGIGLFDVYDLIMEGFIVICLTSVRIDSSWFSLEDEN